VPANPDAGRRNKECTEARKSRQLGSEFVDYFRKAELAVTARFPTAPHLRLIRRPAKAAAHAGHEGFDIWIFANDLGDAL